MPQFYKNFLILVKMHRFTEKLQLAELVSRRAYVDFNVKEALVAGG